MTCPDCLKSVKRRGHNCHLSLKEDKAAWESRVDYVKEDLKDLKERAAKASGGVNMEAKDERSVKIKTFWEDVMSKLDAEDRQDVLTSIQESLGGD